MRAKKLMRLTLFTTCVNFIGYDIYDRTQLAAHWSIKPSHTSAAAFSFGLLKHISAYTNTLKGL